jgi:hypothetical protein
MIVTNILRKIRNIVDPRSNLAKKWQESAENYESRLRSNQHLNQAIVELILKERNRIHELFQSVLPAYKDRISIVVISEPIIDSCAVCEIENHIYVLVSAALIAKPIDFPNIDSTRVWQWLSRHEAAHIHYKHSSILYYVRSIFRIACFTVFGLRLLSLFSLFHSKIDFLVNFAFVVLCIAWIMQTVVSITTEIVADRFANRSIQDPLIFKEAQEFLSRIRSQVINRVPKPFGWIVYLCSSLFVTPYPPLFLRKWLMKKYAKKLLINGVSNGAKAV